jgi:hypothetical protein
MQLVDRTYGDRKTHFFAFGPRAETSIEKLGKSGKDLVTTVMTIDEYRKIYLNLPPLPDGKGAQLLMNPGAVLGGAPATPVTTDRGRPEKYIVYDSIDEMFDSMEPPGKTVEPEGKAQLLARRTRAQERRDKAAAEHTDIFARHFRRQRKHLAEGGRGVTGSRWNDELAADLLKASRKLVSEEGSIQAERLLGTFDMAQVENYLKAGAEAAASGINAQTAKDIQAAKEREAEKGKTFSALAALTVLDGMVAERSEDLGFGRATALFAFATMEAGKQSSKPGELRVKTWVGSGLPDSRHVSVSGETVPLFGAFSNGLQYPGDPNGGAGQTAKCKCLLDIH